MPEQAQSRPALRTNARPAGARSVRTVVRHREQLPGPTVTIGVLCALSTALSAHLRELGDDPSTLGAEVPMAKATVREAHNHFGNVGVGLYPGLEPEERAARIADDLACRRRRAAAPGDAGGQQGLRCRARATFALGRGAVRPDPCARRP